MARSSATVTRTIVAEKPWPVRDGHVVKTGYSECLVEGGARWYASRWIACHAGRSDRRAGQLCHPSSASHAQGPSRHRGDERGAKALTDAARVVRAEPDDRGGRREGWRREPSAVLFQQPGARLPRRRGWTRFPKTSRRLLDVQADASPGLADDPNETGQCRIYPYIFLWTGSTVRSGRRMTRRECACTACCQARLNRRQTSLLRA